MSGRHERRHSRARGSGDPEIRQLSTKTVRKLETEWKRWFDDARLVSGAAGRKRCKNVVTVSHGLCPDWPRVVQGVRCHAPAVTHGTYTVELTVRGYLNLYEAVLPDARHGRRGETSVADAYVAAMRAAGLRATVAREACWGAGGACSVRHSVVGMDPLEFSRRTAKGLRAFVALAERGRRIGSGIRSEHADRPRHRRDRHRHGSGRRDRERSNRDDPNDDPPVVYGLPRETVRETPYELTYEFPYPYTVRASPVFRRPRRFFRREFFNVRRTPTERVRRGRGMRAVRRERGGGRREMGRGGRRR